MILLSRNLRDTCLMPLEYAHFLEREYKKPNRMVKIQGKIIEIIENSFVYRYFISRHNSLDTFGCGIQLPEEREPYGSLPTFTEAMQHNHALPFNLITHKLEG